MNGAQPYTETHAVTDARGSYTVTTVEGAGLTLPPHLAAEGWTLRKDEATQYDLRTPDKRLATLEAENARLWREHLRLVDIVQALLLRAEIGI